MSELLLDGFVDLHCGDCLAVMSTLAECSLDSCVTDPPYHLQSITKRFAKTGRTDKTRTTSGPHQRTANGFMNQQWDGGDVAFRVETWEAVYRVLKPGAYLLAFGGTRTAHRVAMAIENAAFIIHPFIVWMFGQGFPKAHRIVASGLSDLDRATGGWDGWRYGTQSMKPAIEPVYLAQKPFEEGLTGSENIQRWGVGALNIDGCRIQAAFGDEPLKWETPRGGIWRTDAQAQAQAQALGRWPANVITDGSEEVLAAFPETCLSSGGGMKNLRGGVFQSDTRPNITDACGFGDSGSAARFFYTAKADSDDRLGSKHPTVKPLDLMQYLVRLVTPPNGLVLDPFAGTGTTGEAAWREGMRAVLVERETAYQDDIRRRMVLATSSHRERAHEGVKAASKTKPPGPLFGDAP